MTSLVTVGRSEREPERRIAWRSNGGLRNDGDVAFEPIGADATRVRVAIEHDPDGGFAYISGATARFPRNVKELGRRLLEIAPTLR